MTSSVADYVILSEFDIDKGSVVRFQYPKALQIEEQFIAEQMLPDGSHNRDEDCTYFFLNRKSRKIPTSSSRRTPLPSSTPGSLSQQSPSRTKIPTEVLMYMDHLNDWAPVISSNAGDQLVTATSDRGKSVCIVSSLTIGEIISFEFDKEMQYTQLEDMFVSVYASAGTAYGFQFKSVADEADFRAMMHACLERASKHIAPPAPTQPLPDAPMPPAAPSGSRLDAGSSSGTASNASSGSGAGGGRPWYYCLNVVKTLKDKTARRGAIVKAMAICSRMQFVHVFKPLLELALDKFFATGSPDVLAELFDSLNSIDLSSMPQYSPAQKKVYRFCQTQEKLRVFTTHARLADKTIDIAIPLTMQPNEIFERDAKPVSKLIQIFKESAMIMYNAVLCEKRVLFLGYSQPASALCEAVLGACRMIAPPIPGVLDRAFPYASLVNLDFLTVPGYIAGVANPMFEEKQMWWDVLCDLDSAKVTINPVLVAKQALTADASVPWQSICAGDQDVLARATFAVQSSKSEDEVCHIFAELTQHIVDMGCGEEDFVDDASRAAEYRTQAPRILHFRDTLSYQDYLEDQEVTRKQRAVTAIDLPLHIKTLRTRKNLSESAILGIFSDLVTHVQTTDDLIELLSLLPDSDGGLHPLGVALFHSSHPIRVSAVTLLRRIDASKVLVRCMDHLNLFLMLSYTRTARAMFGEIQHPSR